VITVRCFFTGRGRMPGNPAALANLGVDGNGTSSSCSRFFPRLLGSGGNGEGVGSCVADAVRGVGVETPRGVLPGVGAVTMAGKCGLGVTVLAGTGVGAAVETGPGVGVDICARACFLSSFCCRVR
jgi:hypothetical protein